MLSQTAEYALRAAVHLGRSFGSPQTTRQIADATRVPAGYLSKILQLLNRAGLVESQRGLHGGFTLGRPPTDVTVYDVLQAVDPMRRIDACPLGLTHTSKAAAEDVRGLCSLHQRLDDAMATIERAFRDASIADVLDDDDVAGPLCNDRCSTDCANTRRLPTKPNVSPNTNQQRRSNDT